MTDLQSHDGALEAILDGMVGGLSLGNDVAKVQAITRAAIVDLIAREVVGPDSYEDGYATPDLNNLRADQRRRLGTL